MTRLLRFVTIAVLTSVLAMPAAALCEEQKPAEMVKEMADSLAAQPAEQQVGRMGERFLLGPGDTLEISVWNDETLTREVIVRPDGYISFPLIGEVRAEGRSIVEVREAVEEKMQEFVPDVPVTVLLTQLGSTRVYVIGKVPNPGAFMLFDETRVLQLLSMAGGLTTFADSNDIVVIRYVDGKEQLFEFEYDDVANGKDLSQNIILQPGDTVVVP